CAREPGTITSYNPFDVW
nr:immunoglobulin heavy chain junction region [Macaca mulatta]